MRIVFPPVAQARNKSIGEHWHCCVTFEIWGFVWGKKTIVSVTYENVRISIKKVDLILHKMCGRLSCVVHGPIYSRFMPGFYCKRFSLYNTTLAYTLYFECYANGNVDARRCSYFEHGLPVVFLKRISSFWAEHFKDIFRMISHKHPVNKNLINLSPEIIDEIY